MNREQIGFRSELSSNDNNNTFETIVEQCAEFIPPLYLLFIDFETDFETRNTMRNGGISKRAQDRKEKSKRPWFNLTDHGTLFLYIYIY